MKTEPQFQFPKEKRAELKEALKKYFLAELDMELGDLQAELLIDFLNQRIGQHYYNIGVTDTISAVNEKTADLVLLLKDE